MDHKTSRRLMTISLLLSLMALVSITAATAAWMTIADRTRVRTMRMEITTGINLRFDLDPHGTFEEYVKTLSFESISKRILRDKGFDPKDNPLYPVTTTDGRKFTLKSGKQANSKYYLEFTLHFMSTQDMIVHLTSAGAEGTKVSSQTDQLPQAMRLSFTATGKTHIYDPGWTEPFERKGNVTTFGLPADEAHLIYDDGNALFSLKAGVDKPVVVRIWLEGTDEACTDDLRNKDYTIQLRFVGTDEEGNLLEDSRTTGKTTSD